MSMNFGQPQMPPEENKQEVGLMYEPKVLPIEDKGLNGVFGEEDYIPTQHNVVEKIHWKFYEKYSLTSFFGGMEYLFKSSGSKGSLSYGLAFKTIEYEFARANLDEETTIELFKTIADFLETIYVDSKETIVMMEISPADASYTIREIEDCISAIVKHTQKFSEKDLREKYKGFKIFDLYEDIFGKNFLEVHYNHVSKARARSRYFKTHFKKHLKNWEVDEYFGGVSFYLRRKGVKLVEEK